MGIFGKLITPEIVQYSLDEFLNKDIEQYGKRDCVDDILEYIQCEKPGRLLALRGLPHTGQHTILQQVVSELSAEKQKQCMFLEVEQWNGEEAKGIVAVLREAMDEGYRFFFLKNLSNTEYYQSTGYYLIDNFVENRDARLIIYGDNPSSIISRETDGGFYNRVQIVDCSYIDYFTNVRLRAVAVPDAPEETFIGYLKFGNVTQRSFAHDVESIHEYIDTVAKGIFHAEALCYGCNTYPPLLTDNYSEEAIANTLKNEIYASVADIARDAICYAMIEQEVPRTSMKHTLFDKAITDSDILMGKINSILGVPFTDVTDEIRSTLLIKKAPPLRVHRDESYISPNIDEFRELERRERMYLMDSMYTLAGYATLQHCITDLKTTDCDGNVKFVERKEQSIIFQNSSMVYTLLRDIFNKLQQDKWFTLLDIQAMEKFHTDYEKLLLSRLTAHNILCELHYKYKDYISSPLVKKIGYYITINFARIDDKNMRKEPSAAWQIIVCPKRYLERTKNHLNCWDEYHFQENIVKEIGQPLEQILCSPANAVDLISQLPDMLDLTGNN